MGRADLAAPPWRPACPTDPEFQAAFRSYIEWGSRIALENSQPGAKPPPSMPMPRWWWVCDATARLARLGARNRRRRDGQPEIELPGAGEPVGFEQHIKPLFRERDRKSMKFAFDLWSYDDVRANAEAILERRQGGDDAVRRSLAGGLGGSVRALDPDWDGRVGAVLTVGSNPSPCTSI